MRSVADSRAAKDAPVCRLGPLPVATRSGRDRPVTAPPPAQTWHSNAHKHLSAKS
ncbi:hypothetical protein LC55x_2931 [Lysobacter capsici]|nr:hypothetical protein LC55x_2931 [Lysobacter capsici]